MAEAKASDKVKEISEILYKETILPAREESERIISDAKEVAASIIHDAKKEAEKISESVRKKIDEERKVHESSIELAVKQSIATIKSEIMQLFRANLLESLTESLNEQEMCEELLKAMIAGIEKEGIQSDLKLFVSEKVDFERLSKSVIAGVAKKLKKGEVPLSSGVALLIEDKKFSIKTTPETCMKIVAENLSEVLRAKVFV